MLEPIRRGLPKIKRFYGRIVKKRIEYIDDSPKIQNVFPVQVKEKTIIRNELESQFYGCDTSKSFYFPTVNLYHLHDIYLVSKEAWPFLHLNSIFRPAVDVYNQNQDRIKRPVKLLAKEQEGTIFHLAGPNSGNKGHFLVEHLPRLMASLEILKRFSSYNIMLLPERGRAHIPLLNKLDDVSPTEYVESNKGTIKCKELLYTPLLVEKRNLFAPPKIYLKIRDQVIKNTIINKIEPPYLFISRTDAPDRYLLNEAEIFNFLKSYWPKLKLIKLSDYKFDEQINLFNNAMVVIGPHGQAFRNMLYANKCLSIQLQFGKDHMWSSAYNNIATVSGNRSIALYSKTEPDNKGNWYFPEDLLRYYINTVSSILPFYFNNL